MQWLKINSKFIGILYSNYRIIMKWLPPGQVWVIGNPRWETRSFTVLELFFFRVNAVERVSGALRGPGSLEERVAGSLAVWGQFKRRIP